MRAAGGPILGFASVSGFGQATRRAVALSVGDADDDPAVRVNVVKARVAAVFGLGAQQVRFKRLSGDDSFILG